MKKVTIILAAVLFSLATFAQDNNDNNTAKHSVGITIPTVALVDVEDGNGEATSINLTPQVSGLEAGSAITFGTATNNSLWLNYTSVIEEGNGGNSNERAISVKLDDADKLPSGVDILLSAGAASTGNGNRGEAVSGSLTLGETAQNLVTGIGSCYTESGANKGHNLTYSLSMDNAEYEDLMAKSYSVEITYTISGN